MAKRKTKEDLMTLSLDHEAVAAIAKSVKLLTMDAVQKANSGHPGLPLGIAELGALVFSHFLKFNPEDPSWINRDRFVLSAGHGSMLLYSLLYLAGYDLTLGDLKKFRQLLSKTPGHPEVGITAGVETTTGPLGQGFANAVGMAIAEKHLAALFNTGKHTVIDHYIYVIASDGDIMEGIVSEAASLAGHLGLGKLIVFYDSNRITIDGSTDISFSEDVLKRFKGYDWHTVKSSAYDVDRIADLILEAKSVKDKPTLIKVESVIARDAPKLKGTNKSHGAPLGEDEVKATKLALGADADAFFQVDPAAVTYFRKYKGKLKQEYHKWFETFEKWGKANPELLKTWNSYINLVVPKEIKLPEFAVEDKIATRSASGKTLNVIADQLPYLVGGSADLSSSNKTEMNGKGSFSKDNPKGRNIHFGIREHAMASVSNGISLHSGLRPYCSTFLIFSDYLRPALRLSALMQQPVIYVFTHDSVFVGEDGPTHQPIEQLASLRCIPGLQVLRPGDAEEVTEAWMMAVRNNSRPSAIILTRQNLPVFPKPDKAWRENCRNGAYVVCDSGGKTELTIIATGSEVSLAIEAFKKSGKPGIRVVSMISRELFLTSAPGFKEEIIPPKSSRLVIEAGVSMGWYPLLNPRGSIVCMDRFGESGPGNEVYQYLGFTVERILSEINDLLA